MDVKKLTVTKKRRQKW